MKAVNKGIFTVKGQIRGKAGGSLYLYEGGGRDRKPLEVPVDGNGNFECRDTITTASNPAQFDLMDPMGMSLYKGGAAMGIHATFYVESGDVITIDGNQQTFDLADVSGNIYCNQLMELKNAIREPLMKEKAIWDQVKVLMKQRNPANRPKIEELGNSTDPYEDRITAIKKDYVTRHPDYMVSGVALSQLVGKIPMDEVVKLYNALSAKVKASSGGDDVASAIGLGRAEENASVGKPAADFVKTDRDGHTIRLSDYKGKYVLLDFWGSWCGACRASHPHLKKLNAEYAPKGLVILGIAEENSTNRDAWLKAIREDGLPWTQIMNDEGKSRSDVVSLYGIKGFPTKILIGPDGKILLRVEGATVTGGNDTEAAGSASGTSTAAGNTGTAGASASASSASSGDVAPPNRLDIKLREIFKS